MEARHLADDRLPDRLGREHQLDAGDHPHLGDHLLRGPGDAQVTVIDGVGDAGRHGG